MNWRVYADWAKKRPMALRMADRLGRGRGRFRVLDRIHPPPRSAKTPDLTNWHSHELAAVWIGHATILLRIGGLTILTDPVFSNRIGVGLGLITGGPRRLVAPALSIRELPAIDLILSSHAHFDHLDRPTLQRLPKSIPVIAAKHTGELITDLGFKSVTEISWGEMKEFRNVRITAQQVEHWGAQTFHDAHRGFNAYLIESGNRRILFGADTGFHEHFRTIGKVDLAILGIGGYNPYLKSHATPEQAMEMADHVQAEWVLPMHHSTFKLSHEPPAEPMHRLLTLVGATNRRIIAHEVGDSWVLK